MVRAEDDPADLTKPRGKQDWQLEPHSIWYPRTTGIWQTVWLETVPVTRYRRPLFVGETSHIGVGRAHWIREIAAELWSAHDSGVPIEGVCLFPVIDRMDWNDENHWHNSGLWDLERTPDGRLERVLHAEYAEEVRRCQALLARCGWGARPEDHTNQPVA